MATAVAAQPSRNEDEATLRRIWESPPGLAGWMAAVQNDTIGKRYILTGLCFFLVGGIQSLVMRLQLARADQ